MTKTRRGCYYKTLNEEARLSEDLSYISDFTGVSIFSCFASLTLLNLHRKDSLIVWAKYKSRWCTTGNGSHRWGVEGVEELRELREFRGASSLPRERGC